MMGRTHALSGAVAYAAVAPLAHATPVQVAVGAVCTAGAALLPDLDHPKASATHTLGPLTMAVGWVVRLVSGGHRRGTHSVLGAAGFAALGWLASLGDYASMAALWLLAALAVRALRGRDPIVERLVVAVASAGTAWWLVTHYNLHPWFLPLAIGLGATAHILGDAMTEQGVRPLWPVSRWRMRIATIDTGKGVERWLVVPVLWLGLAVLLWRAAGPGVLATINPTTLTGGP